MFIVFFFDQMHRKKKKGGKLSKCIYKPSIACKFLVNSTVSLLEQAKLK